MSKVGQKFNMLTTIRETDERKEGKVVWEFLCDCGNICRKIFSNVKSGKVKSCGCLRKIPKESNYKNIEGMSFNMLTAIKRLYKTDNRQWVWLFKCDCGNLREAIGSAVTQGNIRSCGCDNKVGGYEAADLSGQKFNKLTAIRKTNKNKFGDWLWLFQCDCGNLHETVGTSVTSGHTKSCGCARVEENRSRKIDITGQRFGRLVALEDTGNINKNGTIWSFQCDCGNIHETGISSVLAGRSKSCGCFLSDCVKERFTTHGMSGSYEYNSWLAMKQRCYNQNSNGYEHYGGKGIGIYPEEWRHSFEKFFEYMGPMPNDGQRYTIGRLDNDKNYEPGNVRWETYDQQSKNKGMSSRNSSGYTGVSLVTTKSGYMSAKSHWYDADGNMQTKTFGYDKYDGIENAFDMACKYRDKMIEELRLQGKEYSLTHGK